MLGRLNEYNISIYHLPTKALFNHDSIRIGSTMQFAVLFPKAQDILQTIQSNLHNLDIHHSQKFTQRVNATLLHEKSKNIPEMLVLGL